MLPDPEERKRKRQEAAAKRKAARKKLIIRLCIAAAVLVLCAIVILVITLSAGKDPGSKPQQTDPVVATQPAESEPEKEETTVIHFAATGDLNVSKALVEAGGGAYDFTQVFLDVAPVLSSADLTTVNLEGDFSNYPDGEKHSAPKSMAATLRGMGVDMIQLANSYAINQGVSGLLTTIDAVQQAGMEPVGVFRNEAEYKQKRGISIFEVQGVRIAVVAFTKGMNGDAIPGVDNEDCVNVLYEDYNSVYQKINKDKITQVMGNAKAQKPDITIALVHWGSEHDDTISSSQKNICSLLLEEGADAIIGTHSHRVQEIKFDPEAGTLVAYSLGDLVSTARDETAYSIILDVEITKNNKSGDVAITGYSYTPIFTVGEEGKPLQVVRIAEAMQAYNESFMEAVNQTTYGYMERALTRIRQRISGEG